MTNPLDIRNCTALSPDQLSRLRTLTISDAQVEFGGTFSETLEGCLSDTSGAVQGLCFLKDAEPIGMVVLKRPPATADWVAANAVSLHGFKLDRAWQGKYLGGLAFRLSVQAAASTWPKAEQLVLAVDAENIAALTVYRNFGMADSGPVFSGRIGKEHRLSINLAEADTR
ncbi:GNAT family protein [uncultured Roseobacter sp.]|uniref:GNAT family N-acetyltransferase n=1 Tax=uncultured Roseobacter sp. TaxID=114847 RepID=UPI002604F963|nr:GNAT family protein [uncultured Roseobacter sp.]